MYERPDVPKGGKHRTAIAIAVLVAVAIGLVILVTTLWRLANERSSLGNSELSDAVASATVSADFLASYASSVGLTATGDSISTVLFAVVSDDDEESLTALRIAVLSETQGTAKLIEVPVQAHLTQDSASSLADLYASGGAKAIVGQFATSGQVALTHVVVMSASGWDAFMEVAHQGSSALASKTQELLAGILSSDMDTAELIDIAQRATSTGLTGADITAVPTEEVPDEAGTHLEVDAAQLGLAIGTLAQAQ